MSLKRPFVQKSDVKQWFTTTTTFMNEWKGWIYDVIIDNLQWIFTTHFMNECNAISFEGLVQKWRNVKKVGTSLPQAVPIYHIKSRANDLSHKF